MEMFNLKTKKTLVSVLIIMLIASLAIGLSSCKKEEPKKEEPKKVVVNVLTGELGNEGTELNKRIVAIVVENHPDARPQWGMSGSNSPDIILEGEVEGGISRMLWFYADYDNLPSKVGPVRSARPPFVKFSEIFDAIFIHWGESESGGAYTGADYVFSADGVDHINAFIQADQYDLFGRDEERGTAIEHRGVLYGGKLHEIIESTTDFDMSLNKDNITVLNFNKKAKKLSDSTCASVIVQFSSQSKTSNWAYSEKDHLYHSGSYGSDNDVARENLLILFDSTDYVYKNYKGTYCDYALAGGAAKLISEGTVIDINWAIDENGKLALTDSEGNAVKLNPGKTWIGWASSNNGGSAAVTPMETEEDTSEEG
jgi:hypothetical protein